jgi:hypothetical protein
VRRWCIRTNRLESYFQLFELSFRAYFSLLSFLLGRASPVEKGGSYNVVETFFTLEMENLFGSLDVPKVAVANA